MRSKRRYRAASRSRLNLKKFVLILLLQSLLFSLCSSAITHKTHKTGSNLVKDSGGRTKQSNRQHFDPLYGPNTMLDGIYEASLNGDEVVPDEQKLIAKLLKNYDPAARPVYNASKPVVVKFGFLLVQICDMDERNQILTTNVWLEQEWIDERLQWNESEFNNLDKIRIPCNRIWLPDIVLYNSADDFTESFMQSKAMVKPNGEVFWPPPAKLRSSCKIDVTFFPFDDQVCHIKFGSWTYSGLQVDLVNKSHTTDLTNYIKSGEWELKYVIVERNIQFYPCCPEEPYPDVIFYIHIRRRILYYLFNIILPCVWLSILSLIGFWLPPDTGEKITLGITVLLAFSVFMLLIAENIPATSEMVPLIGIYLTVTMSLTSLSIILTVFVLQLHYAGQYSPRISRSIYHFMTRKLAFLMCMRTTVERYEENMRRNLDKYRTSTTGSGGGGGDVPSSRSSADRCSSVSSCNNQDNSMRFKLLNCERELNKLKSSLNNHHQNQNHNLSKQRGVVKSSNNDIRRISSCCCCCSGVGSGEQHESLANFGGRAKQQQQQHYYQNGSVCSSSVVVDSIRPSLATMATTTVLSAKHTDMIRRPHVNNATLIYQPPSTLDELQHIDDDDDRMIRSFEGASSSGGYNHQRSRASAPTQSTAHFFHSSTTRRSNQQQQQHHCLDKLNELSSQMASCKKFSTASSAASPSQGSRSPHQKHANIINNNTSSNPTNSSFHQRLNSHPLAASTHAVGGCCCYCQRKVADSSLASTTAGTVANRELMDSLEIFSRNLKDYLVKQEIEAIKTNSQSEWKLVAMIVDRILFWVFTFLTVVSSLLLLVAIPIWKNEYLTNGFERNSKN